MGDSAATDRIEREYWRAVERRGRWNMTFLFAQAAFTRAGMVAFVPETVLAAYMTTLTDSRFLVALPAALSIFSWSFPALFYLYFMQFHAQRKGPTLKLGAFVRGSFFIVALSAAAAARFGPGAGLAVFFAAQLLLTATAGGSIMAWQDYLGRTLPPGRRGIFFGLREALTGVVGFAASIALVFYLKGRGSAPGDYAGPFLLGAFFYFISLCLLGAVSEPEWTPRRAPERSWRRFYADTFGVLKTDRNFRTYIIIRCLLAAMSIFNLALFASYAINDFRISKALVAGVFTAAGVLGRMVLAPIAGKIADKAGFRVPLLMGVTLMVAVFATGLLLPLLGPLALAGFLAIYFFSGGATGVTWVATVNLQLEFGTVEDRPRNIALASTLSAPVGLAAGASSGLLVDLLGYRPVLLIALAVAAAVWLTVRTVFEDPRKSAA